MNSITLLGAAEIREIADQLDIKPSKSLGQNFVIDANTCQKIVRLAAVEGNDHVVEVGPGIGSLTLAILQVASRVTAVEIDKRLAARLQTTAREHGAANNSLSIINDDALRITKLPDSPTKLVANLPYNVSVPVFLNFLERFPSITSGVIMVQTEVAERLAAKKGTEAYGVPSAKAAWWSDVSLIDSVSRSVFWPIPNVDSSLVRFVRHQPLGSDQLRAKTFSLIDRAFGQRRKMLRSVFAEIYGGSAAAESALRAVGIDPTSRGESLAIEDFASIARNLDGQ
ncbi:MAG: 16S rRNA (adenine(1518)-N(6)/adenine(1519)-N(6))-dimethyltransferase RsmA [Actinomycetales bacterium]|jgi:16S rRNA (adenine1518-N6/adenine1519-N6)-dimethyltransferase|nr:16S rRNA (adenine(1518)-N(6)/adenine(1519)-N(6))-dimethyltransferase RsmA [Actinomycetales bacterium]